jgi:DNA-binding response OmpR family regulator
MKQPKARVFVVEDHPMTARGIKMFLELSGYAVETVNTMEAALRMAPTATFDVLLCDLNLPDGTGWDLMVQLRKRVAVRGVAYSAFDEQEHVARSRAAGFMEHVVKGATPEELVAAIDRAIRSDLPAPVPPRPARARDRAKLRPTAGTRARGDKRPSV